MATRTKLLRGRNINTDSDFSKYIETVSEPGVIEGLEVSANSVAVGKCWCPCERTNGETIYALVESFTATSIDTSGTGYVIVEIGQTYIDDGSLINEDGTGVATIKVVSELPTKNYLELAELNSGVITDTRNRIKKIGELNTAIESLESSYDNLEDRVEVLEEHGTISRLEELGYRGEGYQNLNAKWFRQYTPTNANSTYDSVCKVGYDAASTEIHIQRIFNGIENNKLKLKVRMIGSPTTNLKVEVREGVETTYESYRKYWYGNSSKILATGSLAYTNFSSSRQEKEFTLDRNIEGNNGMLLDIVVYQETGGSKIVNSSNYYVLACDSKQWSEALRFINVNGNTRTPQKYMPYCISNSFADYVYSKVDSAIGDSTNETLSKTSGSSYGSSVTDTIFTASTTGIYVFQCTGTWSSQNNSSSNLYLYVGDTLIYSLSMYSGVSLAVNVEFTMNSGQALKITYGGPSYTTGGFTGATLKRYTNFFDKGINEHKLKLIEQKSLGLKQKFCSFGRLDDGTRWDGE